MILLYVFLVYIGMGVFYLVFDVKMRQTGALIGSPKFISSEVTLLTPKSTVKSRMGYCYI